MTQICHFTFVKHILLFKEVLCMIPLQLNNNPVRQGRTDGSLLASLIRKRNKGVRTIARECTVRRDSGQENKNLLLYTALPRQHSSCADQFE